MWLSRPHLMCHVVARWVALQQKLLPQIRGLMVTEATVRSSGARVRRLRPPIVLATIRLLRRLPDGALEAQLPALLLVVCRTLRSKVVEP